MSKIHPSKQTGGELFRTLLAKQDQIRESERATYSQDLPSSSQPDITLLHFALAHNAKQESILSDSCETSKGYLEPGSKTPVINVLDPQDDQSDFPVWQYGVYDKDKWFDESYKLYLKYKAEIAKSEEKTAQGPASNKQPSRLASEDPNPIYAHTQNKVLHTSTRGKEEAGRAASQQEEMDIPLYPKDQPVEDTIDPEDPGAVTDLEEPEPPLDLKASAPHNSAVEHQKQASTQDLLEAYKEQFQEIIALHKAHTEDIRTLYKEQAKEMLALREQLKEQSKDLLVLKEQTNKLLELYKKQPEVSSLLADNDTPEERKKYKDYYHLHLTREKYLYPMVVTGAIRQHCKPLLLPAAASNARASPKDSALYLKIHKEP
jgi:hypothetical protein